MNEIMQFLNSHASVRQFKEQDISAEAVETILTTAQRSPTSSNVQAYSAIIVRDKSKKQELSRLSGGQKHVETCPLFVVFCADLYRLKYLNEQRGYAFNGDYTEAFIIATVDATLVAGRALMAAQALGIGGVMVGYPKAVPEVKPRLQWEGLFFEEQYDSSIFDRVIKAYDETIDRAGFLKGREVEPEKYPAFEGQYSWSEHTARRMASTEPSVLRPQMLKYLQSRGFLKK